MFSARVHPCSSRALLSPRKRSLHVRSVLELNQTENPAIHSQEQCVSLCVWAACVCVGRPWSHGCVCVFLAAALWEDVQQQRRRWWSCSLAGASPRGVWEGERHLLEQECKHMERHYLYFIFDSRYSYYTERAAEATRLPASVDDVQWIIF